MKGRAGPNRPAPNNDNICRALSHPNPLVFIKVVGPPASRLGHTGLYHGAGGPGSRVSNSPDGVLAPELSPEGDTRGKLRTGQAPARLNSAGGRCGWWQGRDSNPRPRAYESPALPLSYPAVPFRKDYKDSHLTSSRLPGLFHPAVAHCSGARRYPDPGAHVGQGTDAAPRYTRPADVFPERYKQPVQVEPVPDRYPGLEGPHCLFRGSG